MTPSTLIPQATGSTPPPEQIREKAAALLRQWHAEWKALIKESSPSNTSTSLKAFGADVFGYRLTGNGAFLSFVAGSKPGTRILPCLLRNALKQLRGKKDRYGKVDESPRIHDLDFRFLGRLGDLCVLLPGGAFERERQSIDELEIWWRSPQDVPPNSSTYGLKRIENIIGRTHSASPVGPRFERIEPGHGLVPSVSYFVGRRDEMALLGDFIDRSDNTICVVFGGFGKTEFVRKFLEKPTGRTPGSTSRFPGGVACFDFRRLPGQLTDDAALILMMETMIRASSGIPGGPQDLNWLGHQFAQHMEKRFPNHNAVLLVVDHVPGIKEMVILSKWLPAGGRSRMVFVAGREPPPGTDRLQPFLLHVGDSLKPVEQAVEALRSRFAHLINEDRLSGQFLRNLALQTEGNLNLMERAASEIIYLAHEYSDKEIPRREISSIRTKLLTCGAEEGGGTGHRYVLAKLPDSLKHPLISLGVFCGPFDLHMAGAVLTATGCPTDELATHIEERFCKDHRILSRIVGQDTGQWQFIESSFRELLFSKVGTTDRHRVMLAYSQLYVPILRDLERRYLSAASAPPGPDGESIQTVVSNFHHFWKRDVMHAFSWTASAGLHENFNVADVFLDLMTVAPVLISDALTPQELGHIGRLGIELVAERGNKHVLHRCRATGFIAAFCYRTGLYAGCRELSDKRIHYAKQLRGTAVPDEVATALFVEALWDYARSDAHIKEHLPPSEWLHHFHKAEKQVHELYSTEHGDFWRCQNGAQMGWAFMQAGRIDEALRRLIDTNSVANATANHAVAVKCAIDLGRVLHKGAILNNGNARLLDHAKSHAAEALELAESLGSSYLIALAHRSLSLILEERADFRHALDHAKEWLRWKQANQHPYLERTIQRIARLEEKINRPAP